MKKLITKYKKLKVDVNDELALCKQEALMELPCYPQVCAEER